MAYPRTLVISPCVFNYENGGGVTFSNLFRGFPADRLANLHSSSQKPDNSVCKKFFRLTNDEIVRPWPFQLKAEPTLGSSPSPGGEQRRLKAILAGNSGLPQSFHLTEKLDHWLDSFRPEVIYTILGPIPHLEAILSIQRKFGAKLVIHCMDDWHNQAYTTGIFRYQRRKMLRLLNEIIAKADQCLAIGPAMAKNLSARYGRTFLPFQNTINVEALTREIDSFRFAQVTEKKKLLYYGSVFPFAQLDTIQFTAHALNGTNWELIVRTTHDCAPSLQRAELAGCPIRVEIMETNPTDFPRSLASADALLLPANFDENSVEFLRYSMPTKIPGYLVSGVPVVYFGPAQIAQGTYAAEEGWALCVIRQGERELRESLNRIAQGDPSIERTLQTAKTIAKKNHDEKFVRNSFQEILCQLS